MALLTKHKSFKDLKSSKNSLTKKSLNSTEMSNDFQDFISILRRSVETKDQSNKHITTDGQRFKK